MLFRVEEYVQMKLTPGLKLWTPKSLQCNPVKPHRTPREGTGRKVQGEKSTEVTGLVFVLAAMCPEEDRAEHTQPTQESEVHHWGCFRIICSSHS